MPAPKRLNLVIGGLVVSAFILPGTWDLSKDKPVCKACAPTRTRMKPIADVRQLGFSADLTYTVFQCSACGRQWACNQALPVLPKDGAE